MNDDSETTGLTASHFSYWYDFSRIIIIALFYFLAHGISFLFPDSQKVVMLIWPAGGIGLAAFLLNPKRLWPYLTIAFYIAGLIADSLLAGRSFITGLGFMTGNMVESISCAWLILYFSNDFQKFTRVKEILALIIGAVLINAITACIGAGTSVIFHKGFFAQAWLSWYIADGLGILLIGPFIVSWSTNLKDFISGINWKKIFEWLVCTISWLIMVVFIFYKKENSTFLGAQPYYLVALLVWPAIRLQQRGVTLLLLFLFFAAILSPTIIYGPSPWAGLHPDFSNRLMELQKFLGFLAIVGYLIAAGFTERNLSEENMRKGQQRFDAIIKTTFDGFSAVDFNGNILEVNDAYCKMSGYSREQLLKMNIIDMEYLESADETKERIEKMMEFGSDRFESINKCANGSLINVEVSTTVLNDQKVILAFFKNQTEQMKVEKALIESETKLRALFEASKEAIGVSKNGIHVFANPAYLKLCGLDNYEQLLGTSILEFIAPGYRQFIADNIKRRSQGDSIPSFYEARGLRKNGREFDAEFNVSTYKLNNEIHSVVTIRDITEHKKAELALKESEIRYRSIVEQNNDAITITDTEGNYLMVNQAFSRMTGYTIEELLKMNVSDLMLKKTDKEGFVSIVNDKKSRNRDGEFIRKDGTKLYIHVSGSYLEIGNKHYIQGIVQDITIRKKAEEALSYERNLLSYLLDNTPDHIYFKDIQNRFIRISRAQADMFGLRDPEQAVGKTDFDFFTEEHALQAFETELEIMKTGRSVEGLEEKETWPDGTVTWVSSTKVPLRGIYGEIIGTFGISRDITGHKLAEEELVNHRNNLEDMVKSRTNELDILNDSLKRQVEKKKEIELILQQSLEKEKELSEMKSKFISTTSHEFRTPLTAVLSSAEILQRYSFKWNEERKNEHYTRIYESVEYLIKLLDDILTISRTDSGNINYNPEPVDLMTVVSECEKDMKSLMTANHELKLDYNAEEREFRIDSKLMRFILSNLLSNAVKYSPEGGKIGLTISSDKQNLIIEINDEGIGIPPEEVTRIFDSFYRSKNIGMIPGTGLGLAIVKRAVDLHNGEILVNSELNKGTTFIVKIPI